MHDDDLATLLNVLFAWEIPESLSNHIPPPQLVQFTNGEMPFLHVLNLVRTKHIEGIRRGARVKSLAIASIYSWIHVFKPLLVLALENFFNEPGKNVLAKLFQSINSIDLNQMIRLTSFEKNILRSSEDKTMFEEKNHAKQKDCYYFETRVPFNGIPIPIRIPLSIYPEEIGDFSIIKLFTTFSSSTLSSGHNSIQPLLRVSNGVPFSIHPHLDMGLQTHPLLILINALLTQKRVLFLGYGRPSGEVANFVLAACAIVGGGGSLLRGTVNRCFPYMSLLGIDVLQKEDGYIAGVTNPVFEERTNWWDVLCNINTGKITVSKDLKMPTNINGMNTSDGGVDLEESKNVQNGSLDRNLFNETGNDFIYDTINSIQGHMPELFIRLKVYEYIKRFCELSAAYELHQYGESNISIATYYGDKQKNSENQSKAKGGLLVDEDDGNIYTLELSAGVGPFFHSLSSRTREFATMKNWIEGWRSSINYVHYESDFNARLQRRTIRGIDADHCVSKLRQIEYLSDSDTVTLFLAMQDAICSAVDSQVTEFLSFLPQSQGGLNVLAVGLLHMRWEVRRSTCRIFGRLEIHHVGRKYLKSMNIFFHIIYERALKEINLMDSKLEEEIFSNLSTPTNPTTTNLQFSQQHHHHQDIKIGSTPPADSFGDIKVVKQLVEGTTIPNLKGTKMFGSSFSISNSAAGISAPQSTTELNNNTYESTSTLPFNNEGGNDINIKVYSNNNTHRRTISAQSLNPPSTTNQPQPQQQQQQPIQRNNSSSSISARRLSHSDPNLSHGHHYRPPKESNEWGEHAHPFGNSNLLMSTFEGSEYSGGSTPSLNVQPLTNAITTSIPFASSSTSTTTATNVTKKGIFDVFKSKSRKEKDQLKTSTATTTTTNSNNKNNNPNDNDQKPLPTIIKDPAAATTTTIVKDEAIRVMIEKNRTHQAEVMSQLKQVMVKESSEERSEHVSMAPFQRSTSNSLSFPLSSLLGVAAETEKIKATTPVLMAAPLGRKRSTKVVGSRGILDGYRGGRSDDEDGG